MDVVCVFLLFCSHVLGSRGDGWIPNGTGISEFKVNPAGYVFLAHVDLDGRYFEDIQEGDLIGYYDGTGWHFYKVTSNIVTQASDPHSPTTLLMIEGEWKDPAWIYQNIYRLPNTLVLQTCVEKNGNSSWGRRFVIAIEVEAPHRWNSAEHSVRLRHPNQPQRSIK